MPHQKPKPENFIWTRVGTLWNGHEGGWEWEGRGPGETPPLSPPCRRRHPPSESSSSESLRSPGSRVSPTPPLGLVIQCCFQRMPPKKEGPENKPSFSTSAQTSQAPSPGQVFQPHPSSKAQLQSSFFCEPSWALHRNPGRCPHLQVTQHSGLQSWLPIRFLDKLPKLLIPEPHLHRYSVCVRTIGTSAGGGEDE